MKKNAVPGVAAATRLSRQLFVDGFGKSYVNYAHLVCALRGAGRVVRGWHTRDDPARQPIRVPTRVQMAGAGRGLLLASLLASLLRLATTFSALQSDTNEERGPIIAVMAQPLGNATDYLPASYVKWLELGGARVVPVMYEATDREVDAIFANTNGLLLIGGDAPVCSAARRFLANAVSAAKAGDAYPIWGTCDGFEWLMQMAAEADGALHGGFDSENLPLPLDLTAAAVGSRLLAEAGDTVAQRSPKLSVLEALGSLPVTFNSHKQGVTPATFAASAPLSAFFTVLATNREP